MKIVNDWALLTLASVLVVWMLFIGWFAWGEPVFRPVLDFMGGNEYNMEPAHPVYCPGDMVKVRMNFQKQRDVPGTVKWILRRTDDTAISPYITVYQARPAMAAIGIYNGYVDVERLPADMVPGRYHFEGEILYPQIIGLQTFGVRTGCFDVAVQKDCK
ncbi:MAG: hypothetical protein ACYDHZ_00485 [Dehalococcoidia bacterium]